MIFYVGGQSRFILLECSLILKKVKRRYWLVGASLLLSYEVEVIMQKFKWTFSSILPLSEVLKENHLDIH